MPTKISSYLTELGFRQINALGDSISYNKENAGEFLVVKENNRLYRYESNSVQPIDNLNVLNTSDGGNTRWIAVGGAAMTQTRVNYTFEESSNIIPLGQKVLSKANILYVNIGNTQILSSEYTLNETKDALILPQNFEAGVQTEVVIVIGDFTPESTGLPDQTGQAGKFLTTDGSEASWADITIPENVVSAENYTDAKTWKGTLEEYEALQEYSDNTTYIITDDYTGGSGGTSDYNALENKPSINGVVLEGNKTTEELLIEAGVGDYTQLTNKPTINGVTLDGNKTTADLNIEVGTSNYDQLENKPSINGITLEGNKTTADLNLQPAGEYATVEDLINKQDKLNEEQVAAVNSGITSDKISIYDEYATQLSTKQLISNLSQTIDASTTKYPSNKAVQDAIAASGGGGGSGGANTDLSNITTAGKDVIARNATPYWGSVVDPNWSINTEYTTTANGILRFYTKAKSSTSYKLITRAGGITSTMYFGGGGGYDLLLYPLAKGTTYKIESIGTAPEYSTGFYSLKGGK